MINTASDKQIWNDYVDLKNKLDELFYQSYPKKDYENIVKALFRCATLLENILNDLSADGITPERKEEIQLYLSIIQGHLWEEKSWHTHSRTEPDEKASVLLMKEREE